MVRNPKVSVLVSSYQRPFHLLRVLHSIAAQRNVDGMFEVVVTDDGSKDETLEVVERFAVAQNFPVRWTTHEHQTFQLARCRNDGVRESVAPYLLFLDGDCLIPPDHIEAHLSVREPGVAYAGYAHYLDQAASQQIDVGSVISGDFMNLANNKEAKRLAKLHRKSRLYEMIGHPTKPKLFGGNIGIHRSDYERVNGYDEAFEGWGCEDDDLRLRLRQAGMKIRSIGVLTHTYHLWHPKGETTPDQWRYGINVWRIRLKSRSTQCELGLRQIKKAA